MDYYNIIGINVNCSWIRYLRKSRSAWQVRHVTANSPYLWKKLLALMLMLEELAC